MTGTALNKLIFSIAAAMAITGCAQLPQRTIDQSTRFTLNGLTMTTVKQFPVAAWRGMPAVKSAEDLRATKQLAHEFSYAARRAADQGNMEVAMLSWYAAQQLAGQGVSILGSTLAVIQSIDKNGDTTLAPGAVAMLPAQNMEMGEQITQIGASPLTDLVGQLAGELRYLPRVNITQGVQVAGGGDEVLRSILGVMTAPQQVQSRSGFGANSQAASATDTLPLNTPVAIQGGLYVERRADVLVIYNSTDKPLTVPLSKIGFVPPLAQPSASRVASAPLMRQISSSFWKYADYLAQKHSSFRCEVTRPNKMACAGAESPNFDEKGFLSDDPTPGRKAYENNVAYRGAMDLLVKAAELPAREDFRNTCMYKLGNYFNERVVGPYAEIKKMSCVPNGRSASGATTTDLYLGENGAVKTYATLMNEKATRARMTKEALNAAAWSDAVAYIPVVGTLEDGAKCLGMDSTVVTEIYHKVGTGDLRDSAILAGWRPEPPGDASIADTAMNCIGALPIAATAGKVAKGGAKVFKNGRALTAAVAKSGELFDLFRRALNPSEYASAYASIARKFPNNKDLHKLVEVVSKTLENADAMNSTVSGVASLGSEYLPQFFGAQ